MTLIQRHSPVTRSRRDKIAHLARSIALVVPLALQSGCGDDQEHSHDQAPTRAGDAMPGAQGAAPRAEGKKYAISSNVIGADVAQSQKTSYLWLVDDLESGELKVDAARELPGGATIWGVEGSDLLYVVSAEQLTITKFALRDGKLAETGRLGLGGAGISSLFGERMIFRDASHGFLLDLVSLQALELDLNAMTITRKIDISAARLADAEITSFGDPGFRPHGDRLVNTTYGLTAKYDRVTPTSKLVFFNPADGTIEVKNAPCGGLFYSTITPTGDFYAAADPYAAALHFASVTSAPEPCMVRLPRDSDEADQSFIKLNTVTGGPTGGLIPGSGGVAFFRVLDTNLYKPDPQVPGPYYAAVWQTYQIDLVRPTSAVKVDRPPLAGGIKFFEIDGQAYENESTANFTKTTLIRTTGSGAPARTLSMPGVTWGMVRLH